MSKIKTAFFCSNCGYESAKWLGKCPSCEQWNTFVEEVITKDNRLDERDWKKFGTDKKESRILSLHEVVSAGEKRINSADAELNRVMEIPEAGAFFGGWMRKLNDMITHAEGDNWTVVQ